MDELTTLREAWGPAPVPSPATQAAARAALEQRILAAGPAGSPPRRPPTTRGRGSRRFVAAGAIAVTAAAAAAAALLVTGAPASHPRPAPASAGAGGTGPSARAFLLASAVTVASAPATTGTYWYSRTRTVEPTMPITGHGTVPTTGKSPRKILLPGITFTSTEESWSGQDHTRTIVDENVAFTFASPQVKAEWVALGRPPLATAQGTSTRPFASDYAMSFHYGPGAGLDFSAVRRLPVTASGLGAVLLKMWNAIPDAKKAEVVGVPQPTFGQYLGAWAGALIDGPATPGTKAAAYRLLAGQPGVTVIPSVTDPLGRTGVAIDVTGNYLIIDPRTAQVLASTVSPVLPHSTVGWTSGVSVVLSEGWTSQAGARPRS
jgi:hypothetical protein